MQVFEQGMPTPSVSKNRTKLNELRQKSKHLTWQPSLDPVTNDNLYTVKNRTMVQ